MVGQVPTAAKIKELQRELAVRRNFYPRIIASGKLDKAEAAYRLEVLEAILADYKLKLKQEPLPLSRDQYIKQSNGDFD
jgi:hypothetical protein